MPSIHIKLSDGGERWITWDKEAAPGTDKWKLYGLAQQVWLAFFKDEAALATLVVHYFGAGELFKSERPKLYKLREYIREQMQLQDKSAQVIWTEHIQADLYMALHKIGDTALASLTAELLYQAILNETRRQVELDFAVTPLRGREHKNINLDDAEALELLPADFVMEQAIELQEAIQQTGIRADILKALEEDRPQTAAQRKQLQRWRMSQKGQR